MSAETTPAPRARFHQMKEGTKEDWQIIGPNHAQLCAGLADRVLAHLRLLDGDYGGFAVDRLTHSLSRRRRSPYETDATKSTSSLRSSTTSATRWPPTTTPRSVPRS